MISAKLSVFPDQASCKQLSATFLLLVSFSSVIQTFHVMRVLLLVQRQDTAAFLSIKYVWWKRRFAQFANGTDESGGSVAILRVGLDLQG